MKELPKQPFVSLLIFVLVACAVSFSGNAQTALSKKKTTVQLVSEDDQSIILKFEFGSIRMNSIYGLDSSLKVVSISGGVPILLKGFPGLPKIVESIIIPDDKEMQVEVIASHFYEVDGVNVAPSKGNVKRSVNQENLPLSYVMMMVLK